MHAKRLFFLRFGSLRAARSRLALPVLFALSACASSAGSGQTANGASGGAATTSTGGSSASSGGTTDVSGAVSSGGSGDATGGVAGSAALGGAAPAAAGASAGSGGAVGGGGSSASGGSSAVTCAPDCAVKVTASLGLVDDFEGAGDKLAGGWFAYTDKTGTTADPAPAATDGADGAFAEHFSGSAHTSWGGGLGAWFDGCTDISAYSRIKFKAKGSGSFSVQLVTFETNPCSQGGGCAASCSSNGKLVEVGSDWKDYEIAFAELGGGSAAFSTQKAQSLVFVVQAPDVTPYAWDLWLDDVALAL